MQKLLPLLLAVGTLSVPMVNAQESIALPLAEITPVESKPAAKPEAPKPNANSAPAATEEVRPPVKTIRKRTAFPDRTSSVEEAPETPKKQKKGFWEWLFGPRKTKPAPEPETAPSTPEPTPKATPRPKVRPKGTPSPENPANPVTPETTATPTPKPVKPKATPTPKPEPAETPEKAPEKAPEVKPSTPVPTPTPKKVKPATPAPNASKRPQTTAPISEDADAQEKERYDVAKAKAAEDPEVLKLKEKADGALTDDEARKAQRAYNKALFNKIRSVDGSVKERADRIEAAIMRRLQE